MKDVLDVHTHTLASGHAYNTIMEMAKAASDMGLELLGISDHAPEMPGSAHMFYFSNLKAVPRTLYGLHVLLGTEANIMDFDGRLDLKPGLLEQMDVVIASLHTPCIPCGTMQENTRALLAVIRNPLVHIVGHPDDSRYPVDYKEIVLAAKEHHTLLEVNNHSLDPTGVRKGARENDRKMLEYCVEYQVPVIMGSDAHSAWEIRDHRRALALLEEMNFPEELVVNRSAAVFLKFVER